MKSKGQNLLKLTKKQKITRGELEESFSKEAKNMAKGKIMTNENDEVISVGFWAYWVYFSRYYGPFFVLCLGMAMSTILACRIGFDYMIGQWSNQDPVSQQDQLPFFALSVFVFACGQGVGLLSRSLTCQLFTRKATRKLHKQMIQRVVKAPINLYFDVTPLGRILNKFSKDLNQCETQMPWMIGVFWQMLVMLSQTCILAIYAFNWFAVILPVVFFISYLIVRSSAKAIKETVRVYTTTKSPVLSYLGETVSGSSTIRAFERTDNFKAGFYRLLNNNILAMQMQSGVSGWFSIRVDLLAIFLMLSISFICVMLRDFDPVIMSMLISYLISIQMQLIWGLKCFMYIQSTMVNADRCLKMVEIPQERQPLKSDPDLLQNRPHWPENGDVEFSNVSMRYRPSTEIVLRNLTFRVRRGEKIGIVGRTGAGKSTICLAIARIAEIFEGQIQIDGVDIQQIDLQELRRRITVIPQDPTMFTGSLRFNLDPLGLATDEEIHSLLMKAQLENILYGNPDGLDQQISENGANLSSGERQLICICRAILRKSKLVVLDEATSNIDILTEQKIQGLITTQFKDSTMLVIAHRLNTIINSDRVLVLSFGQIKEFDSPQNLMQNPDSEFTSLLKELKKQEKAEL
mmetsp:Transcript_17853/g.30299  ORF Transcript_17853/g.30299 Transcript_17853/m.30299 type:complete len:632 (+) Transcript_17853:2840-4735(+)